MAGKSPKSPAKEKRTKEPVLLSGGNPQIAKGYGDAPVQAYIAAMPGWKSDVGRNLDAIIMRASPGAAKAVKWNSPFYGVEEGSWFLSFHCFAKYIKVAFFRGASLKPVPPVTSKQEDVRYLHIHEDDELDNERMSLGVNDSQRTECVLSGIVGKRLTYGGGLVRPKASLDEGSKDS